MPDPKVTHFIVPPDKSWRPTDEYGEPVDPVARGVTVVDRTTKRVGKRPDSAKLPNPSRRQWTDTASRAADANVERLITEAGLEGQAWYQLELELIDSEHLGYTVGIGDRSTIVMMSDIPVDEWSTLGHRCYIDGNSWMWKYAPEILRTALGLDESEE